MSWMQQLAAVYNNNTYRIGEFEEVRKQRFTLLPVAHMTQSAQIEIVLSPNGDFVAAKVLEKDQARTIVPMTLGSANRSGAAIRPHYLHDKVFYVAGDYLAYGGEEKRADYFKTYREQLKGWATAPNAPQEVQAIYTYIVKAQVVQDLVEAGIFPVDTDGNVLTKWTGDDKPAIYKVATGNILDSFIRFNVQMPHYQPVWENTALYDSYIAYFNEVAESERGTCYVTAQANAILTTQHGSRIRNAGDLSKLISSNDDTGFTYRGRFKEVDEAVQIGYEVSQKSHHALRWLIQRQGTYVDSRYFVAFGVEQPDIIDPFADGDYGMSEFETEATGAIKAACTKEVIAKTLAANLHGIGPILPEDKREQIIIMAVDAATSGRLAIVYYQQTNPKQYIEALSHWYTTCRWLQVTQDKETKQIKRGIYTPSTYRIVEAVYGSKADPRIKKELYTRLLPCIIEKKPIPKDIVQLIFNRIKNPSSFKGLMESWETTLNIACALITKQFESEGYTVAIQEDNNSRDYLFGRLLGVAEVMERSVLKERGENRSTNATRYFNAFSQRPARTWHVIRKQLNPYFERQGTKATRYAKIIQELEARLTIEQMTDATLSPVFLLGYSSQVQAMYTKKEEVTNDNTNE